MLIFGLATIENIHQAQLITPVIITSKRRISINNRKTDNSLTRMLVLQVILLTIFNIPQAIQKLYITNTFYQSKSPLDKAIENFLFNIAVLATYIPHCLPFYLYTFTGSVFRKTLFKLLRTMIQRLKCTIR
jgi:hypothetical protein